MTYELSCGFREGRMRLDRIFMTGDILKVKEIGIIFNNPIHEKEKRETEKNGYLKGGLSWISDKVGRNLFRVKEKYLFKSDHFGIQSVF